MLVNSAGAPSPRSALAWRYQPPRSCPQSRWRVGLFVVCRHELTDESWAVIEPLLAPPRMGRPVRDRRQVVNGILWKLSTGAAWRDLPERFGPWKTVYERFRRWSANGTWDCLLAHVQQHSDAVGSIDWSIVCIDSTTVRAHQHATGARKRGSTGRARRSAAPAAD